MFGDIWWEQRPQPVNLHPENTQRPERKCLNSKLRVSSTLQLCENSRNRSAGPSWFPILSLWPDPRVSRQNMNMYRVSPDPGEGRVHEATHRVVHTAAFHPFSSGSQAPLSGPRAALESGCFVSTAQCGQDQPPGFNRKLNFTPKLGNKQTNILQSDRN